MIFSMEQECWDFIKLWKSHWPQLSTLCLSILFIEVGESGIEADGCSHLCGALWLTYFIFDMVAWQWFWRLRYETLYALRIVLLSQKLFKALLQFQIICFDNFKDCMLHYIDSTYCYHILSWSFEHYSFYLS